MKEIIITAENEKHIQKVLDILSKAEENGELDFSFSIRREW